MTDTGEVEQKVVTALAEALYDDPFYMTITVDFESDEATRRAVLMEYCRYSLREGYRIGAAVTDSDGGAIWTLPQPLEVAQQAAIAKRAAFASLLGPCGFNHYRAILAFMEPTAQAVIPADAWYLSILGVAPQRQGQGLGRALLEPMLKRADQSRSRCFLETFSSAAVQFYRRLGFGEVAEHWEPTIGAHYWIMLREPHSPLNATTFQR